MMNERQECNHGSLVSKIVYQNTIGCVREDFFMKCVDCPMSRTHIVATAKGCS